MELLVHVVHSGDDVSEPGLLRGPCNLSTESLPWVGVRMGYVRISKVSRCRIGPLGTQGPLGGNPVSPTLYIYIYKIIYSVYIYIYIYIYIN